jgi:hypothetical protein
LKTFCVSRRDILSLTYSRGLQRKFTEHSHVNIKQNILPRVENFEGDCYNIRPSLKVSPQY